MCNQAIMIVTDGISGNLSDTINKYIDLYNGSNIPRLFTYLIGKEVTNVPEIKWIACANRGIKNCEQKTTNKSIKFYQFCLLRVVFSCTKFRTSNSICIKIYKRNCETIGLTIRTTSSFVDSCLRRFNGNETTKKKNENIP